MVKITSAVGIRNFLSDPSSNLISNWSFSNLGSCPVPNIVLSEAIKGGEISWYSFWLTCVSSIKFDNALSNKANLFLTKTNLDPVVFVARSKSSISRFSPRS